MGLLGRIRQMSRALRRHRLEELLSDLQDWECEGRDLIAQAMELTDPEDDLHCELRRVLEALDGQ